MAALPALLGLTACAQPRTRGDEDRSDHHAWLGVQLQDMTPRLARDISVKTESGALVRSVVEESPAEKAGLKEDDIIVEFNGKKIDDSDDLVRAVRDVKPGATANVAVVRNDERKSLTATLGEMPRHEEQFENAPHLLPSFPGMERIEIFGGADEYGLHLSTLNRQLGAYFGAPNNHGVLVEEVQKRSPAEKAGFMAGDVIVKVGSDVIEDTRDVFSALEEFKKGDKASFEVIRKGDRKTLSLEIGQESGGTMRHFRIFRNNGDRWYRGDWGLPENDNQWQFQDNGFRMKMEELGKELRETGKKLRDDLSGLRDRLRREIRTVTGA